MKCKTMQGLQDVASNQMTSDDEEEHNDGGVGLGGSMAPPCQHCTCHGPAVALAAVPAGDVLLAWQQWWHCWWWQSAG